MANILLSIEKGVEAGAEDVLKFISGAEVKVAKASPGAIAGLAVLVDAASKAAGDVAAAAASPMSITLDAAVVADFKSALPEVKAFLTSLGVKF